MKRPHDEEDANDQSKRHRREAISLGSKRPIEGGSPQAGSKRPRQVLKPVPNNARSIEVGSSGTNRRTTISQYFTAAPQVERKGATVGLAKNNAKTIPSTLGTMERPIELDFDDDAIPPKPTPSKFKAIVCPHHDYYSVDTSMSVIIAKQ
ncbi:hypothetical protein VNI00_002410 [Paramarasmius palmivorus]|uniref:Uncharacterized protein n=1 Tax=Paramarasmius palmivorus TaxID=297713 RepID=A0AAW0DZ61_9AGAR